MAKTYTVSKPFSYIPVNTQRVEKLSRYNAEDYYQNKFNGMGKQILHTGVLNCTLEVVTPLAIPDVTATDPNNHNEYNFYAENGKLTIPGSSLRGILRSVYEAVTKSCYSMVNKEDTQTNNKRDREQISKMLSKIDRCKSRTSVCDACLLFGMVRGEGDNNTSLGSRIRVTDAHIEDEDDILNPESNTLKELFQPKCSVQKDKKGNVIEFSGRKFYWNERDPFDYTADSTKRNVTIGLLKPEKSEKPIRFTFQIYYDEIREEQLNKLLWVITLGQNKLPDELSEKEELLCHKLGRGKPLGLGSVKIKVDKNIERICNEGIYRIEEKQIKIKNYTEKTFEEIKNVSYMRPRFSAMIIDGGKEKGNFNFIEYKIYIQEAPEYKKKNCILSVYKNKNTIYKKGDTVDVFLYREDYNKAIFNCPKTR